MWGSTEIMARAIEDGMVSAGANVIVLPMKSSDRSVVVTEVLEAGALLVGSPTLNNGVFPTMADTLTYMKGLKPRNLVGAAFGSFGWSGEAVKVLNDYLEQIKVEIVSEPLNLQFVPDAEGIEQCRRFGEAVAARLKEVVQNGA
jgi:flavorubredoxin